MLTLGIRRRSRTYSIADGRLGTRCRLAVYNKYPLSIAYQAVLALTFCKLGNEVFPFSCRGHFLLGFFDQLVDTIAQDVWLL